MKKLITIFCLSLSITAQGQDNNKFIKAMETNVAALDKAQTVEDFQACANAFERISNAEPKEWLPLYYNAFADLMIGIEQTENAKKDDFYDKAKVLAEKADELSKNNSEIYALRSFIVSMKLSVDPMNRGRELGMEAGMLTSTAMKLDSLNPRPYFLKGQGMMYTPVQFGGGKDKALPLLEHAVAKYQTFKPKSSIMPHWGETKAKESLEQCKKME